MATANKGADASGVLLGIHLDIGHSSIGWAVTRSTSPLVFVGCGTVLFPKDGCWTSERRANRRQRRHIRSTRQRIARMRVLLAHLEVLTEEELCQPGCAWPWKLAAEVLAGQRLLSWRELWGVLRWYAHNRGYDGNAAWQRGVEEDEETKESSQNARALMERHNTHSMAETVCAEMGISPGGRKCSSHIRYKASKASFPREVVVEEVHRILQAHLGQLPNLDGEVIRALLGSPLEDKLAWKAVPCPSLALPKRYAGGLLFGQLIPRFDNRIIGSCPISGDKRPLKRCPEFLEYRWAMQLANIRVCRPGDGESSPLTSAERVQVTQMLREQGYFTKTALKKAVYEASGIQETNLDDMLLHPDAERALVLYPALYERNHGELKQVWETLPKAIQRRVLRSLNRGRQISFQEIREWLPEPPAFDECIERVKAKARGKKKGTDVLKKKCRANFPPGRAPYGRTVMRQAVQEVMEGQDPRAEGGVLYVASQQPELAEHQIDQHTNNHLVRHRLKILRRLVVDIVQEYAEGDLALIENITIEMNREVKELSGKSAKQIARELNLRLKSHQAAVKYASKELDIPESKLGGAFIRKVRIAMDLEWTCPYTGELYEIHQLRDGSVDLDHIIPRSKRMSDSLDSLVVTFKTVNAWKSNSTAMDFIEAHGGEPVPGMPNLSILSPDRYQKLVERLRKRRMPHSSGIGEGKTDDERRRDNRCRRLLMHSADQQAAKGFTPRDLTVSSHLVTLASAVVRDLFADQEIPPAIHAIPGRVTKEVRMAFELLGMLAKVNPQVLTEDGELKTKSEIRGISHLHHAVDAVTLGLATSLIPVDGTVWALMGKRGLENHERKQLERTRAFTFDAKGRPFLRPLHEETRSSIQTCLAECRVFTHMPSSRHGAELEKTVWGIVKEEDGMVELRQRARDEKTGAIARKTDELKSSVVLGTSPKGPSKLRAIKGAIVISKNYGVALDPEPEVIPYHHVWRRIGAIKRRNGGTMPRIIRNGMLLRVLKGRYEGIWRVFSVKGAAAGLLIDMGQPDAVKLKNKTPGHCINVSLKTLLESGLSILPTTYTGVPRNGASHR